jgi:hypothetical protein
MNTPVSFELAKLLKEKGFDFPVNNYTSERDGDYFSNEKQTVGYRNYNEIGGHYSRPTIAEAVMWLYEKHEVWITVTSISQESWQCHMTKKEDSLGKYYLEDFNSPTEAYQDAIEYTLNNLT